MPLRCFRYFSLLFLWITPLSAAQVDTTHQEEHKHAFTYTHAAILGSIQGVTEFLPVSSSGHLILANHLMGLNAEEPVRLDNGDEVLFKNGSGVLESYTLEDAANAYMIILHGACLLATLIVFRQRIFEMIAGILGKNPRGLFLARNLIIAFIPPGLVGLAIGKYVDGVLYNPANVAMGLVIGAFLMFAGEFWRGRRQDPHTAGYELHQLTVIQCLIIGFAQILAFWPGMSRSMVTILGCYCVGLRPVRAVEFSFLLGLVTISSATGYKIFMQGEQMLHGLSLGPTLLGCFMALIFSVLTIQWFMEFMRRHGLYIFGVYRIFLAIFAWFILIR